MSDKEGKGGIKTTWPPRVASHGPCLSEEKEAQTRQGMQESASAQNPKTGI